MNHSVIVKENQTVTVQKLGIFNNSFAEFKIAKCFSKCASST